MSASFRHAGPIPLVTCLPAASSSALLLAGSQLKGPGADDGGHQDPRSLGSLELLPSGKAAARASRLSSSPSEKLARTEEPLSTHPLDALETSAGTSWLNWQGLRLCSSPGWCFTGLGRHWPLKTPLVKA